MNLQMRSLAAVCLLLLCGCAALPVAPAGAAAPPASEALHGLVERYFDDVLALNPVFATFIGDARYNDRLDISPSPAHEALQLEVERRYLEAVEAIDPAQLTEADALVRETFLYGRRMQLDGARFPGRLMPLDQFNGGIAELLPLLGSGDGAQPFATVDDYDRWFRRAQRFPEWVDAAIDAMREGMARGVTVPRMAMAKTVPALGQLIAASPGDSVFFGPVQKMPQEWPEETRERIRQSIGRLVEDSLNPAYARLRDFIRDEYLPACRESVGWSDLPDGRAWYAYTVSLMTTSAATGHTVEDIHRRGLAEVARIRGEMQDVMRKVGFAGDLPAFFRYVQDEPSFYFDEPSQLIAAYEELKARINAALPAQFSHFPKSDYEIRPIEPFRAAAAAGASYQMASADGSRPGIFYVNTYNLKAQPKFGMETLSLHEASPGHHFQISMQQELTGVPRFQRFFGNVAYAEGWALYSESLGRDLGLFTDPMQYYGRLSDEMLRAMRLVVDTGLHAKGWSREQAIRYMHDNSSMADTDIVAEVERYIVSPGQALGYKIGEQRIREIRTRAEAVLGERFDVREFHWQVLKDGSLPMDVLARKIDRWVASQQSAAK